MTADQMRAVAYRVIEELWNQGNLAVADELYAPEYVDHNAPPGTPAGPEGVKLGVQMTRAAFPDLHITAEHVIVEGDMTATHWRATGTHMGEFRGIPATGRQISIDGITVDRTVDGKTVEAWGRGDDLGLMMQLGVIPMPEQRFVEPPAAKERAV